MDRGTYRYREKQGEIEKQLKVRERQIQRQRRGKKNYIQTDGERKKLIQDSHSEFREIEIAVEKKTID